MKPEELKSYLDEYLVKQDEAKEVLATKVCTHFNRIKAFESQNKDKRHESVGEIKNNIIMIGPTGVGKTFLVKLIARKIGVPFVKGDATKFSETGYVGGDVEDLVRDLVYEANGNIDLAQYGIIYLDEVDKIAASPNLIGPDVSRSGVQRALLKPMEETEVELKVPHDPVSQMEAIMEFQKTGKREKKKINTKYILFIMSGAFNWAGRDHQKAAKPAGNRLWRRDQVQGRTGRIPETSESRRFDPVWVRVGVHRPAAGGHRIRASGGRGPLQHSAQPEDPRLSSARSGTSKPTGSTCSSKTRRSGGSPRMPSRSAPGPGVW